MTHEYTLLVGGVVRAAGGDSAAAGGAGGTSATALAYAHDTILAVGSDAEVRAISRGDSHVVELAGRTVVAAEGVVLEPGAPASFDIVDAGAGTVAVVRDGRVIDGGMPGLG